MHTEGFTNVFHDLYINDPLHKNIFQCTQNTSCFKSIIVEIHKYMYLKVFAIFIKNMNVDLRV